MRAILEKNETKLKAQQEEIQLLKSQIMNMDIGNDFEDKQNAKQSTIFD